MADIDPDLYLLGIPSAAQSRKPGPGLYPPRFNPNLKEVWDSLFEGDAGQLITGLPLNKAWESAIREFMYAAKSRGVDPFNSQYYGSQNNSRILLAMKRSRHNVLKYLERTKLMEQVSIKSIDRRVRVEESEGFTLIVESTVNLKRMGLENLVQIIEWLSTKGEMIPTGGGTLERRLDRHTRLYIDPRRRIPKIYYEVEIDEVPYINPKNALVVSKKRYASFVVNKLWLPLVRATPVPGYSGRFLF